MKRNRTKEALDLMKKNPEMTVYAAAKEVGMTPTSLYAGKRRAEIAEKVERCQCCGQPLPKKV